MLFGLIAAVIMIVSSLIGYAASKAGEKKKRELSSIKFKDKEIEEDS